MKLVISHPWNPTPSEAQALQLQLAARVVTQTTFEPGQVRTVAGIDVSIGNGEAQAAVVVLSFPDLAPLDLARASAPAEYPYVPGLLTFREGPSVLAAFEGLRIWPDLLIFDGQGIAHPRRIGLAAHLGVLLDQPSIGCAKSRLVGRYQEPGEAAGDWSPLLDGEETIGAVVRTRARVKPVFVSIGHRIDLPTAVEFVLRCTRGYRLPETTRYAHKAAGGARLAISPHLALERGQ